MNRLQRCLLVAALAPLLFSLLLLAVVPVPPAASGEVACGQVINFASDSRPSVCHHAATRQAIMGVGLLLGTLVWAAVGVSLLAEPRRRWWRGWTN